MTILGMLYLVISMIQFYLCAFYFLRSKWILQKTKEKETWAVEYQTHSFFFIVGPIYPKQSFEVKINCIKTTSIYKLIYNYNRILLTFKCRAERKQYTLGRKPKIDSHVHKTLIFNLSYRWDGSGFPFMCGSKTGRENRHLAWKHWIINERKTKMVSPHSSQDVSAIIVPKT